MTDSLATRIETLEAQDRVDGISVTSDPNGSIEGTALLFAIDRGNQKLYICFGGKVWKEITTI